ncbi:MAG: class I SAM-dependent methyltransferase [Planctomycetota bacterium]
MGSQSRFEALFFELFEALPRQGPGSERSTRRAFEACAGLPRPARVADLGCGGGAQTAALAGLVDGPIVALDRHRPLLDRLRAQLIADRLEARVQAIHGDFAEPPLERGAFDLVWSEGALYNLGRPRAFQVCASLLRPGGWLAFTDAVWRVDDPPAEVRAIFDADYPTMGQVPKVANDLAAAGFHLAEHFPLPAEDWWDAFYDPLVERLEALRADVADDAEALAALDALAAEPELHRTHGEAYGYEFFVARWE